MNSLSADISITGQKLEGVTSFKYLEVTLCKDGICSAEIRVRIVSVIAALTGLDRIWPVSYTHLTLPTTRMV